MPANFSRQLPVPWMAPHATAAIRPRGGRGRPLRLRYDSMRAPSDDATTPTTAAEPQTNLERAVPGHIHTISQTRAAILPSVDEPFAPPARSIVEEQAARASSRQAGIVTASASAVNPTKVLDRLIRTVYPGVIFATARAGVGEAASLADGDAGVSEVCVFVLS